MHKSVLQPLHLLLLGYGNVARAFLPLLASRCEWLAHELGIRPLISGIGTRKQGFFVHPQGVAATRLAQEAQPLLAFRRYPDIHAVADAATFIQTGKEAGASLLIELTTLQPQNGQPALSHIRQALTAGMDVVTANKGPVAHAQSELQSIAQSQHVQFRFESTVMDGLPLINLAQFTLRAVGMRSFRALLNATSSLVLSMIEQGAPLEEAIKQAQELGIAEADPWYDLDGWDAVMETTILANNLLGAQLAPLQVTREGIRNLSLATIREAASSGTPIRLLSRGERHNGLVTAGQCTITAKRLDHQISTTTKTTGGQTRVVSTTDVYAPYFEFTVQTTNHRSYAANGYDGTTDYTSDYTGEQAIVDSYQLGHTYQCWYDQSNPTQAVLVRNPDWVAILVAAGFLVGAGLFLLVGILMLLGRFNTNRVSSYGEVTLSWNEEEIAPTASEESYNSTVFAEEL